MVKNTAGLDVKAVPGIFAAVEEVARVTGGVLIEQVRAAMKAQQSSQRASISFAAATSRDESADPAPLGSAQDFKDAELVGREGVRALVRRQEADKMVSLCSLDDLTAPAFGLVPLHAAAGARRPIPAA